MINKTSTVTPELSLVIPCYNEEETIENVASKLVNDLTQANINFELILVDNGSHDNSALILKDLASRFTQIRIVTVEVNEGFGWGVINGLNNCSGKYIGWLPADGQISPEDAINVFRKLKSDDLDICKGKRIMRYDGVFRIFLSRSFNFLFSILCSSNLDDVNGHPKIMKHDCYKKLNISSKDFFIDAEILLKAEAMGLKMGYVPVEFKKREKGKSKVRLFKTILEFMKNMINYRLQGFD